MSVGDVRFFMCIPKKNSYSGKGYKGQNVNPRCARRISNENNGLQEGP